MKKYKLNYNHVINVHSKENYQEKLLLTMQVYQRGSGEGERNIKYKKFALLQYI